MVGRHKFKAVEFGPAIGLFTGGLEIVAVLDEVGPKGTHGAVLLDRISVRHIDRHRHAITVCRVGEALAMIARRRRDQSDRARTFAVEAIDIDQPAPDLEGAGRRVVLMLDDRSCAKPLGQ